MRQRFQGRRLLVTGGAGFLGSHLCDALLGDGSYYGSAIGYVFDGVAITQPGTILELKYLYAFSGGSLFQPVYLHPRDDLAAAGA